MGVRHLPVTSLRMFVLTVVRDPISDTRGTSGRFQLMIDSLSRGRSTRVRCEGDLMRV